MRKSNICKRAFRVGPEQTFAPICKREIRCVNMSENDGSVSVVLGVMCACTRKREKHGR